MNNFQFKMIFTLFLLGTYYIAFGQESNVKIEEARVFFKSFIEASSSDQRSQAFPNLADCKLIFNSATAEEYYKNVSVEITNNNSYAEWFDNKANDIEVYPFTKKDILENNGKYRGGGGMIKLANRINDNITLYSLRYKNSEGSQITNIFLFFNGRSWKLIPKPWRFIEN